MISAQSSAQVYLSYCNQDTNWVKDNLLPRLQHAGIHVHESKIGVPKVLDAERAIKETSFTLLVISRNYLENNWKKYDAFLAASFSASENTWNALPILMERCPLPAILDNLVPLDLSEPTEEKWHQLLRRILDDDYEKGNDPIGGLVEPDPILNKLMFQLNEFQDQLHQVHNNIRITQPYLSQLREFSTIMEEYLPQLRKEVSEGSGEKSGDAS